jgi:N-hydroxyarylamine O-acetyltransferase
MNRYLDLIGFKNKPQANFETLYELHLLHTLKFPFENITPFLYQEVKLDVESVRNKFLAEGRGGYCFEQNLLFLTALREVGFIVRPLAGRVLWNQPEDLVTRRSHMLLLVDIQGKQYLCDVGFGGLTLTTPIKFEINQEQKTTHEFFRIGSIGEDLKLQAKVGQEWKTLYRFDLQEQQPVDYEVANFYLYTHPSSIFRNNLIAGTPVTNGRYALSNNQFTHYKLNGEAEKKILTSVSEVRDVLTDIFKIKLPAHPELNASIESVLKKN